MKTSKLLKKLSAFVLVFAMVFGLIGVSGSTITANAAADKVKMYCYEPTFNKQGFVTAYVYIQINDSATNKEVYVHHQTYTGGTWRDSEASYLATLSDGSQIWRAVVSAGNLAYAIRYVGDNQTYWDNNNGNNYTAADRLGSAPIKVNRLSIYNQQSFSSYSVEVTLKNLAYTKVVKVRYTEDNWATFKEAPLSYVSSDTSKGTEIWSTTLSMNTDEDNFGYCVSYQVNGQTYWDNNFGSNYGQYNFYYD